MTTAKYAQLSGRASVGDIHNLDITQFSVSYGVNSIPVATMVVPAGSKMGGSTSTLFSKLQSMARRQPVSITLESNGALIGGGGSMKVFDGYSTSIAFSCAPGQYGVQLAAAGWLDDLRATSCFTEQRTPRATFDFYAPTAFVSGAGSTDGQVTYEGVVSATYEQVGKGNLYEVFSKITRNIAAGKVGANPAAYSNATVLQALNKITGNIKFSFEMFPSVVDKVSGAVSAAMFYLYDGSVIWDSWIKLADQFMFMIVPTVNSAKVVAYDPMLASAALTISPAQYVYINNVSVTRKSVAGMLLIDNVASTTSGDIQRITPVSLSYIGGTQGMLDTAPVPMWLSGPVALTVSKNTYNALDGIRSRAWDETAKSDIDSISRQWKEDRPKIKEIGSIYAKSVLGDRLFGENMMTITGPLRFDVTPGMIVAVQGLADNRAGSGKELLYGFVNNVTLAVNADTGSASTSIMLSHVRNESDNIAYGLKTSALYSSSYRTGSLLD